MVSSENFVFSRAAVARMLKIDRALVKRVEVWSNCVFVIVVGRRPRFWKKSDFQNHFVDHRKNESKYYSAVSMVNEEFNVWSRDGKRYILKGLPETVQCPCEDYQNQQRIFKGKGCCKHGYAVLSFLGFDRLSEYIENNRWLNNGNDNDYDENPKDLKRREDAKKLKTTRLDLYSFQVKDLKSNAAYYPELKANTIQCTCEDYNINSRCKHGYAVLKALNFENFSDYIHQFEYLQDDYEEIDYEKAKASIF